MSRADGFDFTLDEETEKRLYDLLTNMDTRNTNRFWITDKRGYHAEYAKIIRCKDCALWNDADSEHFAGYCTQGDYEKITFRNEWCCWAERK